VVLRFVGFELVTFRGNWWFSRVFINHDVSSNILIRFFFLPSFLKCLDLILEEESCHVLGQYPGSNLHPSSYACPHCHTSCDGGGSSQSFFCVLPGWGSWVLLPEINCLHNHTHNYTPLLEDSFFISIQPINLLCRPKSNSCYWEERG